MPAINSENAKGWQIIADMLARQRPYVGRTGTIIRGRKLLGERVTVLRHMLDKYSDVYRYSSSASANMKDMRGREGWVCLVRTDSGIEKWVKANYIACDYRYDDWTVALSDAVQCKR